MHVYRGCLSSGCNIKEMNNDTFIIAEFHDGLQLIPATWYNADNLSSIWPTHFKTKLRINKAIMTKEMPREKSDWEVLPIKKVFGTASKNINNIQYKFFFVIYNFYYIILF